MKPTVAEIAKQISELNPLQLDKLSSVLLTEHNISATIYNCAVVPVIYDMNTLKTECDLVLLETGSQKLMLVKTIKEIFDLGLRDAKMIIDNAPCYLKEFIEINKAKEIKKSLENIGAKVEIRYHDE